MGLIKELLLLPADPVRIPLWMAGKATTTVSDEAQRQLSSPAARVRRLQEIQEAREEGRLDEEEAAELEGQVLEQQMAPAPNGQGGPGKPPA